MSGVEVLGAPVVVRVGVLLCEHRVRAAVLCVARRRPVARRKDPEPCPTPTQITPRSQIAPRSWTRTESVATSLAILVSALSAFAASTSASTSSSDPFICVCATHDFSKCAARTFFALVLWIDRVC